MMVDLTYPAKFSPMVLQKAPIKVAKGGRGSAKSRSFGKLATVRSSRENIRIACVREIQSSIKDSVHKIIADTISEIRLDNFFEITDKAIRSWTGAEFIFKGLHRNVQEIKSLEGVDICWIEEGEGVTQESLDILIPTVLRKPGSEIWVSFNPEIEDSPCNKTFVTNPLPGTIIVEMNWRDNPWFTDELRMQMDWCRETDFEKYEWIWEGKYKKYAEDVIFKDKIEVDCDFESPDGIQKYQGLDFGFSNDPMSFHQMFIHDNSLFIEYEAYGRGVEIEETPAFLETVPNAKMWRITADSARPETISYLLNKGFNIVGAEKGKGSVEDGISFLRSFKKIYIHRRCTGAKDDYKNYRWKRDRITNEILPIPLDKSNHTIDDNRYALEAYIKSDMDIYSAIKS